MSDVGSDEGYSDSRVSAGLKVGCVSHATYTHAPSFDARNAHDMPGQKERNRHPGKHLHHRTAQRRRVFRRLLVRGLVRSDAACEAVRGTAWGMCTGKRRCWSHRKAKRGARRARHAGHHPHHRREVRCLVKIQGLRRRGRGRGRDRMWRSESAGSALSQPCMAQACVRVCYARFSCVRGSHRAARPCSSISWRTGLASWTPFALGFAKNSSIMRLPRRIMYSTVVKSRFEIPPPILGCRKKWRRYSVNACRELYRLATCTYLGLGADKAQTLTVQCKDRTLGLRILFHCSIGNATMCGQSRGDAKHARHRVYSGCPCSSSQDRGEKAGMHEAALPPTISEQK